MDGWGWTVEEEDQRWPLWDATPLLGMSIVGAWLSEDVTMMAMSDWDCVSAGRVLTGQGEDAASPGRGLTGRM